MSNTKIIQGQRGEDIAVDLLRKKGYKILQKNFKIRYGEIDIIAIDQSDSEKTLVFIEVKTRRSTQFGNPLDAITPWKLRSVIKTAQYYKLTHRNLPDKLRIDAVSVKLHDDDSIADVELVKNISGF